jgi:amidohydrolase
MVEKIKELAFKGKETCIAWRRHLHANPELSFHEVQTAEYIRAALQSMGFKNIETIGDTGILVTIHGGKKGKTVLLRADTDALPIQESNVLAYQSTAPGVMHACGHDAHTAMLLLASKILIELETYLAGTIKILFQPAEELIPGGALKMIKAGVLKKPDVDAAIGQHVMPGLPVGKVGIKSGRFMASSDNFTVTVRGKGGHAAMPENLIDPVLISGHLIVALQQVVSRNRSPKIPTVLSIGKVIAQGSSNVIPDEVVLEGTFRTLDPEWREEALVRIEKLVTEFTEAMGGTCAIDFSRGYPPLQNDPTLTAGIKASIIEYVGADNVVDVDSWMAAEDFAHYSQLVPSTFYLLGTRNEAKGIASGLHTSTFNIDEDVLHMGAGLMAWLAYRQLR